MDFNLDKMKVTLDTAAAADDDAFNGITNG